MSVRAPSSVKQIRSWHSDNGRWLATLSLKPPQLAQRAGLEFRRETDDLGSYAVAFVRLSSGPDFMLRCDDHPNIAGTMVWAPTEVSATKTQLRSLLAALNVRADEVAEVSPELKLRQT